MKQKQIIISLGAGINQVPLIKEIKKNGFECLAFDRDPSAPGFEYADLYEIISSYDYGKIIDYLERNTEILDRTVGVLTRSTGMPVLSAAKIARHFGFKYMDVEIAEIIIDKAKLLTTLNGLGIPSPKVVVSQGEAPKDIKFPVFVKPSKTILSHTAMKKCYNFDELKKAIKRACEVSDNGKVNIEEFLTGYDIVSIDFVETGKILHVCNIGELTRGEPDFVGIGWYTAFKEVENVVAETIKIFVEKLKIKHGFFQTAMKVSSDFKSAKIYEIHGEIGGDLTSDVFLPECFSYNIFKQNIAFILNKNIELPINYNNYCVLIINSKNLKHRFFNFNRQEKMIEFLNSIKEVHYFNE